MRIERFDPALDPVRTAACHEILLAAAPADGRPHPWMSPRAFAGWLTFGWTEAPSQSWLALGPDARTPTGWYSLSLPDREDPHLAVLTLITHPSWRRRGVGAALLRHAAGQARAAGRTLLSGESRHEGPGACFARAAGARPGIAEVHRVLALADLPAGRRAELRERAQAAAAGYALDSWTGPAPEAELAGVARVTAAENDAPRQAGRREESRWDPGRVRQAERRVAAQGLRRHTVVARVRATGELAALTQLGVDPADETWGFQELTAVDRPHRGRRLGLLVKLGMLELLAEREPQLARIITGNADSNRHMIAINDELGFRPADRWQDWELPVSAALAGPAPGQPRQPRRPGQS